MRFHVIVGASTLALLMFFGATEAHPAAVSGTVVDESGQPLEGAVARILPVASRGRGGGGGGAFAAPSQPTDDAGRFAFGSIGSGMQVLEVSLSGHRTHRELLGNSDGSQLDRTITLPIGDSPDAMPWVGSLGEALRRAGDERLPVMIFMTMDGESANDRMARNTYREPSVLELGSHLLPILSTTFTHAEDAGSECPKYGTITCTEHIDTEARVIATYFSTGPAVQVPQHVFLTPAGSIITKRVFEVDSATLRNMMIQAIRRVNPDRAIQAASRYYANLTETLRFGDATERGRAFEDLLRLSRAGDEVARTALFAADPSSLSAAQESELLEILLRRMEASTSNPFGRLVSHGSANLRAEAMSRVSELEESRAFSAYLAMLTHATDAPTRASVEAALGVRRDATGLRFTGMSEKRSVLVAIAMAKHGDRAALPTLYETVTDAKSLRRTDAAIALLNYRPDDVMPYLQREIAQGGVEKALLARVVGELRDRRGTEVLLAALADTSLGLRITAAMALGRLGDRRAVAALADLVRQAELDDSIRVAAAASLVDLGSDEGVQALIEAADDPVLGDGARAALRKAHATSVPRSSEEWRRWWDDRPARDS